MLKGIKLALRISSDAFDEEINDLIEAAKQDLRVSGVNNLILTDPLIKRAITLYCKANFGYDNPDAERFMESFTMLKTHLTLSTDYTEVG